MKVPTHRLVTKQILTKQHQMLRYVEKESAIKMAREAGMSDKEILKCVLRGESGGNNRRELVIEWGKALGYDASDALRLAHSAGLIPSPHPPRKKKETPRREN